MAVSTKSMTWKFVPVYQWGNYLNFDKHAASFMTPPNPMLKTLRMTRSAGSIESNPHQFQHIRIRKAGGTFLHSENGM